MQPFTHPDLIREIHNSKIREALEHRHDGDGGMRRAAISGIRALTGGALIAIGTRLAPTEGPEPSPVIDLAAHRAESAGETEAGSRPAA